jgi:hypothetical protein
MTLKDSQNVIDSFTINGRQIGIRLNKENTTVFQEERHLSALIESLGTRYGGLKRVPFSVAEQNGLLLLQRYNQWVVLKKMDAPGAGIYCAKRK